MSTPSANAPTPSGTLQLDVAGRIDIGGRSIEITCQGHGAPVVVLEAGLGNPLDVWGRVMDRVDDFTTVCAYSRAGLGNSDSRPVPHGGAAAADDLAALLTAVHAPPSVILVGASYGGVVVQLFARRHPGQVQGVVLVDAIAAGWDDRLEALLTPAQIAARRAIPNGEDVTNEEIRESERAIPTAGAFPAIPLVVLRHGVPFPGPADWPTAQVETLWTSLQNELATSTPKSVELLAAESGHRIHQDQPDLVAEAIRAIVDPSLWPPKAVARANFGDGAPPVQPGAISGHLVFTSPAGLVVAKGDGTSRRTIVPADGRILGEPSADPAGRVVAFTSMTPAVPGSGPQPDSTSEIWLVDASTGVPRRLVDDGRSPALSPDGKRLAFVRTGHTYLLDVTTTLAPAVDLGEGGCPLWSPDGSKLAMCTNDGMAIVLDVAGEALQDLLTGPPPNEPTAWSPDGMKLALSSARNGDVDLYILSLDGSPEQRISEAPGSQAGAPWIAEGLLVTSSAPDQDVSDWYLVDPQSGAVQVVPWMHGIPNPIAWYPG